MDSSPYTSVWNKFWHAPLRAERLALMRILLGSALLTQQLLEYLPNLEEFFGPHGIAPADLLDRTQLDYWYWTMLIFNTDDMTTISTVFAIWVAVTIAFTAGFYTRLMNVALWILTMCFLSRNAFFLDGGDDTLQVGLFLMMLSPSGRALSIDAWLRRRRGLDGGPVFTVAWPVRLIQIQLCVIYCTTGLVKLEGGLPSPDGTGWFASTWWDGTSIHYVLNYLTMSRYSYASLPLPLWVTATMTYVTVWWEALFPLLVSWRWTRKWTLAFGIVFHIGIWLTLAIGWFGFYMIAFYGVWVPCDFWERRLGRSNAKPSVQLEPQRQM
jgi:hypothetical protein